MPEPTPALQLIVGLGNPGPQYASTRHNAGFWLLDELAHHYKVNFRVESKFSGEVGRLDGVEGAVWLLKPLTFMNLSGQAVVSLAGFYKILPSAILVVHDEVDLPVGTVRSKRSGSHGGHNGLRDTVRQLGTNDFLRVRLGIGHPGNSREVINYVLRPAPQEEQQLLQAAIADTIEVFPLLLEGQLERAMNVLHSRRMNAPAQD